MNCENRKLEINKIWLWLPKIQFLANVNLQYWAKFFNNPYILFQRVNLLPKLWNFAQIWSHCNLNFDFVLKMGWFNSLKHNGANYPLSPPFPRGASTGCLNRGRRCTSSHPFESLIRANRVLLLLESSLSRRSSENCSKHVARDFWKCCYFVHSMIIR